MIGSAPLAAFLKNCLRDCSSSFFLFFSIKFLNLKINKYKNAFFRHHFLIVIVSFDIESVLIIELPAQVPSQAFPHEYMQYI